MAISKAFFSDLFDFFYFIISQLQFSFSLLWKFYWEIILYYIILFFYALLLIIILFILLFPLLKRFLMNIWKPFSTHCFDCSIFLSISVDNDYNVKAEPNIYLKMNKFNLCIMYINIYINIYI